MPDLRRSGQVGEGHRANWIIRPGDVLISPVPLGDPFRRYVFHRSGIPDAGLDFQPGEGVRADRRPRSRGPVRERGPEPPTGLKVPTAH
ncbi:hypothetical protein ACFYWO_31260 [Streptomyces sp. NPDC002932]|uniref:preATP grasp domain-containing protein n=1 Tax=Streptomyces sp. NPDC002932 TaxID=3364672 RepID=UPI00368ACF32